ncbi:MAG: hypothetical protein HUJ53_00140 [Holdemanella sp.]|nr:hypothetical protein [Holdemanella sp.]
MNKEQDEISKLLDSMNESDELDKKMNAFAKKKQRPSTESKEVDLTQIEILPIHSKPAKEETIVLGVEDQIGSTRTMDWNQNKPSQPQPSGGTVVINDKEIKSLLDEEKGPKLRREVVRKKTKKVVSAQPEPEESYSNHQKKDKSTIALVLLGILGIVLAGALIIGVVSIVGSMLKDEEISSELQDKYYKEIMEWAESYSTYSDKEKEKIIDLEAKFNKLTKQQKADIDDVLIAQTGKTFDELLAKAKSSSEDKKNNNTEIAEKKAKIKEEISELKSKLKKAETELEDAEEDLDDAKSELDKAQSALDSAKQDIEDAQIAKDSAQHEYDVVNDRINELIGKQTPETPLTEEEQTELSEKQSRLPILAQNVTDAETNLKNVKSKYDLSKLEKSVSKAQTKVDEATEKVNQAKTTVDSYNQQIAELQKKYDELDEEED